jgi:hypothetical protein
MANGRGWAHGGRSTGPRTAEGLARSTLLPAARGAVNVDAFCALERNANIGQAIQEIERSLAAAKSAEAVREQSQFSIFRLPTVDAAAIDTVLQRSLQTLEAEAAGRVQRISLL